METTRFRLTIKEPMGAPPPVPGEPDIVHGLTIVIRHDEILVGASTDDPSDLARHLTTRLRVARNPAHAGRGVGRSARHPDAALMAWTFTTRKAQNTGSGGARARGCSRGATLNARRKSQFSLST